MKKGFDGDYFDKFHLSRSGKLRNFKKRFLFVALFTGIGLLLCLIGVLITRGLVNR